MNGQPIEQSTVHVLLEAARWAPSCFNEQEWLFAYAHRDKPQWETFMGMLVDFNQQWCKNAGVLFVLCSRKTFARNGKPNATHSLDTGAALQNLLLQASSLGLVGHAMSGIDQDEITSQLNIGSDINIECMIAVGHPAPSDSLPAELQEKEQVSSRKPISEFSAEGKLP
jgi:nitroreductase